MIDKNGMEIMLGNTVIHYFKNGKPNIKGIVESESIVKVIERWNEYKRENSLLSSKIVGGWESINYNYRHRIKSNNIYEIVMD